jgi:type IV secretory pathway TrbD component
MRTRSIYRSLNEERMYGGVQKNLVLGNVAFVVLAVTGLGWWWFLVPSSLFHFLMRNINKRDPKVVQVYTRYAKQGTRYDPWPHQGQKVARRPVGFGRGQMC